MTLKELWNATEAVIFDFDGVLADSEPFYRKSWNSVLSHYGHTVSKADYWKHWAFLGEGLSGEMERTGLQIDNTEAAKLKQKTLYRSFCESGDIQLFYRAAEAVAFAMKHKPCAIASNTESSLVRMIARQLGSNLPPIIGGEGLRSKPAPDIFQRAAELLGFSPEHCLVLEDAMKGIKAGLSAGMPVVLVRNKYNRNFSGAGASCEIDGIGSLLGILEEQEC